jgi:hypothetical protein
VTTYIGVGGPAPAYTVTSSNGSVNVGSQTIAITDSRSWAEAFLAAAGLPLTQSNITAVMAWEQAEGQWTAKGAYNASEQHNPLNTTRNTGLAGNPLGGTPLPMTPGVLSFPSWGAGIEASVATLFQRNMFPIYVALSGGNGSQTLPQALAQADWGTRPDAVAQILHQGPVNETAQTSGGGGGGLLSIPDFFSRQFVERVLWVVGGVALTVVGLAFIGVGVGVGRPAMTVLETVGIGPRSIQRRRSLREQTTAFQEREAARRVSEQERHAQRIIEARERGRVSRLGMRTRAEQEARRRQAEAEARIRTRQAESEARIREAREQARLRRLHERRLTEEQIARIRARRFYSAAETPRME